MDYSNPMNQIMKTTQRLSAFALGAAMALNLSAQSLKVGGSIWNDLNGNGLQEAGEPGIDHVGAVLFRDNGNGEWGWDDEWMPQGIHHGPDGAYWFEGLEPGDYFIWIEPHNFQKDQYGSGHLSYLESSPGAADPNLDLKGDDHGIDAPFRIGEGIYSSLIELTAGAEPVDDGDSDPDTNLTIDFGFYQSSTPPILELGGTIWLDANSNGIQEANESPVSNASINLTIIHPQPDGNDNFIHFGNRWPDENGFYLFGALPPGTYVLSMDGGNFMTNNSLVGMQSSPGETAANDDIDGVDDGMDDPSPFSNGISSGYFELANGTEPTSEDGDANTNLTFDFGFVDYPFEIGPVLDPVSGNAYMIIQAPGGIDWDTARAEAENETYNGLSGHLATITCEREQQFLARNFPEAHEAQFWLGGIQPGDTSDPDPDPAAGWEWVTGEEFGPELWETFGLPFGEPNDCECVGGKEDALHLWAGLEGWNDIPREFLIAGYVVEFSATLNPDCSNKAFNPATGHFYESVSVPEGITWYDAQAQAESMGGTLATIQSPVEQGFIVSAFPESVYDWHGYWLGGFQPGDTPEIEEDPADGWIWVTGEEFDKNLWTHFGEPHGEPNDCECVGGKEDALHLWAHGDGWNDLPAEHTTNGYIVEYPGDDDGDGILNEDDACPDSILDETVVIGNNDSGVENILFDSGCTLADLIEEIAAISKNHGQFVSGVAQLTNELRKNGILSAKESSAIQRTAAKSK